MRLDMTSLIRGRPTRPTGVLHIDAGRIHRQAPPDLKDSLFSWAEKIPRWVECHPGTSVVQLPDGRVVVDVQAIRWSPKLEGCAVKTQRVDLPPGHPALAGDADPQEVADELPVVDQILHLPAARMQPPPAIKLLARELHEIDHEAEAANPRRPR